jgi:hypothetical protein
LEKVVAGDDWPGEAPYHELSIQTVATVAATKVHGRIGEISIVLAANRTIRSHVKVRPNPEPATNTRRENVVSIPGETKAWTNRAKGKPATRSTK